MNRPTSILPTTARWALVTALGSLGITTAQQPSRSPLDTPTLVFDDATRILATADLDGDGDRDAVGIWGRTDVTTRIHAYANDGLGHYALGWAFNDLATLQDRQVSVRMEVGDFDGDGRDDLVTRLGSRFTVLRSNGSNQLPTTIATWFEFRAGVDGEILVADFDGDGLDDFAADIGGRLMQYRNTGLGFAIAAELVFPNGRGDLDQADVDGDGDSDLIVGRPGWVDLLVNDGGTLRVGASIRHSATRTDLPLMVVAGDIDGDGDDDIVAFGEWGAYSVLRHGPAGVFTREGLVPGGPATGLADLDGDGDLDGVCCGGGGGGNTFINIDRSTFHLSLNDGTGRFSVAWEIPSFGASRLAAAEDLDGDGDTDLIAGRVVWQTEPDTFAAHPRPRSGVWIPQFGAKVADLDRDGDPDVAVSDQSDYRAHFINDGSGRFEHTTAAIQPPTGLRFADSGWRADFDGDGDVDIVLALLDGAGDFARMEIYRNLGNGQFADSGPAAADGWSPSPYGWGMSLSDVLFDWDGDGDLDGTTIYGQIADNDGTGFFAPGPTFSGGDPMGAADLDGDGDQDLILGRNARIEFSYQTNGVFGGFGDRQWFSAPGDRAGKVAVGDFDGDGDPDVAYVNGGLVVWENQGNRNWNPTSVVGDPPMTYGVKFVHAADFDLDGDLDLVAGGADYDMFVYVENLGGFRWGAPALQLGALPHLAMDGDGDGDVDLYADGVIRNVTRDRSAGRREQFGQGLAGTGGLVPVIGAEGPFTVGSTVKTVVRGAPGGAFAAWLWGIQRTDLADTPLPGIHHYCWPPVVAFTVGFSGNPGEAGTGEAELPYPVLPSAAGIELIQQFHILDAATPAGIGYTGGLAIRFGH